MPRSVLIATRHRSPARRATGVLLALLTAALLAGPAAAQTGEAMSPADLRQENERLRSRVRDLELELKAARERLRQLESGQGTGTSTVPASPTPIAPTPGSGTGAGTGAGAGAAAPPAASTSGSAAPDSDPAALFAAMKADHDQVMGDAPSFREGERERALYLRALERWLTGANRRFRARVEWPVMVRAETLRPAERGRDRGMAMQALVIDPASRRVIGEPVEVFLPIGQARRFERLFQRHPDEPFVLRGALVPAARINPTRDTVGPFDNPPLLGPFVEFALGVEASSLAPIDHESDRDTRAAERP